MLRKLFSVPNNIIINFSLYIPQSITKVWNLNFQWLILCYPLRSRESIISNTHMLWSHNNSYLGLKFQINALFMWRLIMKQTLVFVSHRTSSCCTRKERIPAACFPKHQGKQWQPGSSTSSNFPKVSVIATVDWSTWIHPRACPIFWSKTIIPTSITTHSFQSIH